MTFKELEIGDYFVHWNTDDRCFIMYRKVTDNIATYTWYNTDTGELNDGDMAVMFNWNVTVYKVIV